MFITFGIFNFKLFLLLVYPIARLTEEYFDDNIPILYNYFITYFSFLLAGIFYLIILSKSKKKNNTQIYIDADIGSAISQINIERKKEKIKRKRNEIIYLFLLALLYLFPVCTVFIFENKFNDDDNNLSKIIAGVSMFYFYIIFSKLLLGDKIYSHRFFSVITITICIFIFFLIDKLFMFGIKTFAIFFLYQFTIRIIDALYSVLLKIHFNTYLTDPYLVIFYLGFFTLLILVPFEIIYHIVSDGKSNLLGEGTIRQFKSFSKNYQKNILYFILLIFMNILRHGSQILIIYHFTPCHFIVSLMIYSTIVLIKAWVSHVNTNKFLRVLDLICFIVLNIIIVFSSLVYNEVIIIKLFGLEKNTAKYISIRQKEEYEKLDKIIDDDENDENDEHNDDEDILAHVEFQNITEEK